MHSQRSSSITDIHQIELVPAPDHADITRRLRKTIEKAICFRGVICYWTVAPDFVSAQLPALLALPNSFLCVDIHRPTDIEQLDRLAALDAHVRIHLRDLAGHTEERLDGHKDMPEHLLHAKLLLFDFDDGTAEIWSGSHNWTQRALAGPNFEASLIALVSQESSLYAQARALLAKAYELTEPFDRDRKDWYWALQGQQDEAAVYVLHLCGHDVADLTGSVIQVFGADRKDLPQFRTIERDIILSVEDSDGGEGQHPYLYDTLILQTGLIGTGDPTIDGVQFSKRRYALRYGEDDPTLTEPDEVPEGVVETFKYFITLRVGRMYPQTTITRDATESGVQWIRHDQDALMERMRPIHRFDLKRRHKLVMRVPHTLSNLAKTPGQVTLFAQMPQAANNQRPLLVRKILVDLASLEAAEDT